MKFIITTIEQESINSNAEFPEMKANLISVYKFEFTPVEPITSIDLLGPLSIMLPESDHRVSTWMAAFKNSTFFDIKLTVNIPS